VERDRDEETKKRDERLSDIALHLCLLYTRCSVHNTRGARKAPLHFVRAEEFKEVSGFMQDGAKGIIKRTTVITAPDVKYLHFCF